MTTTWDDLVPSTSNYLAKEDVGEDGIDLTIRGFKQDTVGQGEQAEKKAIMGFVEDYKPMILNKTNMRRLIAVTGAEKPADAKGKVINVYNDPLVEYAGRIVGGLRIRQAQGKAPEAKDNDGFDDDIPFN